MGTQKNKINQFITFKLKKIKQNLFLIIILVIACSIITKPFSYTLTAIDPSKGTVKATLEKTTAVIQTKGKTSATSSSYTISTSKSLVRIKIADAVFQSSGRTELGGPSDYITLYKLSSGKTSRSFTINTDGTTNAALIPIKFTPTETGTDTKIAPAQALATGEYAFIDMSTKNADGNITVWTFGID